jgi:hypothetical protein
MMWRGAGCRCRCRCRCRTLTSEDRRLTVDPAAGCTMAEAFGCERVLFGDTDVLEGESFEDHGVEVGGPRFSLLTHCPHRSVCVLCLTAAHLCMLRVCWRQREHQDTEGDCEGSSRGAGGMQPECSRSLWQ